MVAGEHLTGSDLQVEDAKHAFRVFAKRKDNPADPSDYDVPHTAMTYLLGRDGRYLTHIADATPEKEVVSVLRRHVVGAP